MRGLSVIVSFAVFLTAAADMVRDPESMKNYTQFGIATPGVTPEMLYADFWIANTTDADTILMDWEAITKFNRIALDEEKTLVDLADYPKTLSGSKVAELAKSISSRPRSARFHRFGAELGDADYERYFNNMALESIPKTVNVRFGVAVERGLIRTFPTADKVTNSWKDPEVDMFVETAIYPGEAVAVLHTSRDGKFHLIQKYNYLAWAPAELIAIGSKKEVIDYVEATDFLVVTGAKVFPVHNPVKPDLSERQFDMGCRIPLCTEDPGEIDRMGTEVGYAVILPRRGADGELSFAPALIPRSADVNAGFLPYTRANILRQAFKFTGERYGWGDDNNARDCSGFLVSVFSSFGLVMPRNGGAQESHPAGVFFDLSGLDNPAREQVLRGMLPGDSISSPTHIMMFIGAYGDELYMIHDHLGSSFVVDGKVVNVDTRGVGVTPILGYMISNGKRHYYEAFTGIKRFVLNEQERD